MGTPGWLGQYSTVGNGVDNGDGDDEVELRSGWTRESEMGYRWCDCNLRSMCATLLQSLQRSECSLQSRQPNSAGFSSQP